MGRGDPVAPHAMLKGALYLAIYKDRPVLLMQAA